MRNGKGIVRKLNKAIRQSTEDSPLVLGEISPQLLRFTSSQAYKRFLARGNYQAPEDDIIQIGSAGPPRKK